jgi:hypothetical protein
MYQVAKDLLVPLIAPAVAIIVPTIVFFVIPRRRDRQKAALDLFAAFWAEDMRQCRHEAWAYLVTQVNNNPEERNKRFDQFLDLLTSDRVTTSVTPEAAHVLLKASWVLDYLAVVEGVRPPGLG